MLSGHLLPIPQVLHSCQVSRFGWDSPGFGPMSRLCPGLPDIAALSRNPARLHKWRCGTSINSVYYRISVHISRYLVGVAIHNRPKVGVVTGKWAWSIKFRTRFARINSVLFVVLVSPLINLATMVLGHSKSTRAHRAHTPRAMAIPSMAMPLFRGLYSWKFNLLLLTNFFVSF